MDKAVACVLLSTRPTPSNSSRVSWLKSVSATRRARLARPASRQTPRRSADRGRRVSFRQQRAAHAWSPARAMRAAAIDTSRVRPTSVPPPGADQHRQRGRTCAFWDWWCRS